jgi:hypothetical protein
MSNYPNFVSRRDLLAAAAAGRISVLIPTEVQAASANLRPFQVSFPDEALADLSHRIGATRWPTEELVSNASPGVQLSTMRKLADDWERYHDKLKTEAGLNAWRLSINKMDTSWSPQPIARAWVTLMERLGYTRYVAQGGDWGDAFRAQTAWQAPPNLRSTHTNTRATGPESIARALAVNVPAPTGILADEKNEHDQPRFSYQRDLSYARGMANGPQTPYTPEGSPIGLAAWMSDHDRRS